MSLIIETVVLLFLFTTYSITNPFCK